MMPRCVGACLWVLALPRKPATRIQCCNFTPTSSYPSAVLLHIIVHSRAPTPSFTITIASFHGDEQVTTSILPIDSVVGRPLTSSLDFDCLDPATPPSLLNTTNNIDASTFQPPPAHCCKYGAHSFPPSARAHAKSTSVWERRGSIFTPAFDKSSSQTRHSPR